MKIISYDKSMYAEIYQIWQKTHITLGTSDAYDRILNFSIRNPETFLVAEENGKIIGVVMGGSDARRGYVHHLAVDPKYQKHGFGKLLMEELMKRFKKLDIQKIHLFIDKSNMGVIDFYQKLGWILREDLEMMSYVP